MSSERQEYSENSPWWGEHAHRYYMTFQYISSNNRILDIACGNGFGSYMLSKKTINTVIGADISEETIVACSAKFSDNSNLIFKFVDGTKMPFQDCYFDTIVSFETIEHTTSYLKMLSEFNRTLKDGGLAIISTPNIVINSPKGVVLNPYHTQEFTYDELKNYLEDAFSYVKIFGQKYIRYNKKSFRNSIGKIVETLLYQRGVRKIPLSVQNAIMRMLIWKNMYPLGDDFSLVEEKNEILKCKTFFAVCHKK